MKKEILQQLHQTLSYSKIGATIHQLYPKLFKKKHYSRQRIHQILMGYSSYKKVE
jgi:hypothetical protein